MPRRRGANTVEFALVLPVFTTFLLFTVEFGVYLFQQQNLYSAVIRGCRNAATYHPNDTGNENPATVATNYISQFMLDRVGIDCADTDVDCTFTNWSGQDTDGAYRVKCDASIAYDGLILPMGRLESTPPIRARSMENMEFHN